MRRSLSAAVVLLALCVPCWAQRFGAKGPPEFAYLPGVAFSKTAVFARVPTGGVQAIDIEKGTILWRSTRARWPLVYGDGRVVALGGLTHGNYCSIVFLDEDTGRSTFEAGPIQFPSWADVNFDYKKRSESDFRIWLRSMTTDGAIFLWNASRWPQTDYRHINSSQKKMFASGRITVSFANNAVQSWLGPVASAPASGNRADGSLPLLRGQRGLGSIYVDSNTELALISSSSGVDLACFRNRMLVWSVTVSQG